MMKKQFEDYWFEIGVQDEYEAEFGDQVTDEDIKRQLSNDKHNAFVEAVWEKAYNKYVTEEELSICCGAKIICHDICSDCKEHCK